MGSKYLKYSILFLKHDHCSARPVSTRLCLWTFCTTTKRMCTRCVRTHVKLFQILIKCFFGYFNPINTFLIVKIYSLRGDLTYVSARWTSLAQTVSNVFVLSEASVKSPQNLFIFIHITWIRTSFQGGPNLRWDLLNIHAGVLASSDRSNLKVELNVKFCVVKPCLFAASFVNDCAHDPGPFQKCWDRYIGGFMSQRSKILMFLHKNVPMLRKICKFGNILINMQNKT